MSTETLGTEQEKKPGGFLEAFLRKPCDSGEITKDSEGEHVAFRNNMQFILALRKHEDTEDRSLIREWLERYSAEFGTAFDEVIGKDPRFFDGYNTMGDIPEDKWQELESLIYSK